MLVQVGDSGTLSRMLNTRELDVAIVAEPSGERHVLQVPAGLSRLAWFASPALELPRGPMTPALLADRHLMISPPTARLHATVMRWFGEAGVDQRTHGDGAPGARVSKARRDKPGGGAPCPGLVARQ